MRRSRKSFPLSRSNQGESMTSVTPPAGAFRRQTILYTGMLLVVVVALALIRASGEALQATESSTGPYELVDFFLYHFLRWAEPPEKILFLASHAKFHNDYTPDELRRWLRVFLTRFFQNQFKRSCLPDGPKVGSVSVSPRGDWRMPSDASARAWLEGW